jgi:hypothetical protein
MNMLLRTAFVAGIACFAACGNSAERAPAKFQGPYSGTVTARIHANDGAGARAPESGTASAVFVPTGAGERLEVKANIRREGDSGFVVNGRASGGAWQGRGGPLGLTVDDDGRISGGGIEKGHRISFAGQVDAGRMDLTVETRQLAPPGERIVFEYRLARDAASRPLASGRAAAVPEGRRADGKGACKRRVWKTRNVAAPGGGMVMTQVPHCVD